VYVPNGLVNQSKVIDAFVVALLFELDFNLIANVSPFSNNQSSIIIQDFSSQFTISLLIGSTYVA
jgi:hypothetical protein